MDRDTEADRTRVADAAGLSEAHGGTSVLGKRIRYQTECPKEQGLVLSVSRTWDTDDQGEAPADMLIVCPVCAEEHTLARIT